ncbi:DUF2138 family protein [Janthinobacterium sp. PC23-8]|uniref:DUF2138 family protein n=1 Tax=Janthinobacterium sp. PC23-8 TaxID=2012679 RepID=UPI000B95FA8F|nr:DUF2138 family protein [Janthinobacterium sp. PC23-8]OYO31266.1 hypothetical protein CD932_09150 [Janthinobacterium sp. PC23-8]
MLAKKGFNKKVLFGALAGVAVVAAALVGYRVFGWGAMGPVNSLKLDLSRPDALVRTNSLSTLPRDLLTVPLARDVLREEFLFYYEQSEDRLGLKGSLRRIAYEHQLGWGDQLLRMVLDQPAEVALWRDADGSLKHFAIAVSRKQLTRILEEAAKVALKDTQMSVAGSLRVDGDSVPVYALNYAWQRTLLFAAHGQRLVILSHPGMLYGGADHKDGDGTAEKTVVSLLGKDADKQNVFHPQFHLDNAAPEGHSIAVKADFLSFGYQPFFGALEALRFDFQHGAWQSKVLLNGDKLKNGGKDGYDSSALWPVLPHNPSACFSVPVDWSALQPVLKRLGSKTTEPVAPLAEHLQGPAAACWYGNSRLHTPVFVATRKPQAGDDAAVVNIYGSLFEAAIGGKDPVRKSTGKDGAGEFVRWERTIATALGPTTAALAVAGNTVVFSADGKLVDQVLAVRRKQAAAASDLLPDGAHTVGLIAPASLARLIQFEAFDTLPANNEPVLRAAANEHLVPRLDALKKYPPLRMVLKRQPASGTGMVWEALEWQEAAR